MLYFAQVTSLFATREFGCQSQQVCTFFLNLGKWFGAICQKAPVKTTRKLNEQRAVLTCRNLGCSCSHSRTADQMCRQQSRAQLTAEEQLAAEESFSLYCKPVELYNILQRRATRNVTFLDT